MNLRSSSVLVVAIFLAAVLSFAAPGAQARSGETLTLTITFSYTSTATVTLDDGTQIGTTGGTPTVIPAGFYSLDFVQPGCTAVPMFTMAGPDVSIQDDLEGGELTTDSADADFQPNSTYTWKVDSQPNVVHTFVTSNQVLGTPPPPAAAIVGSIDPYTGSKKQTSGNSSVVGSTVMATRGSLAGAVTSAGKLTLSFKGKSASSLAAGRYTISVADASKHTGFVLENAKHALLTVTGVSFVGKRSVTVNLTAGRWLVTNGAGKTLHTLVVG
jgi:hypothetical protein